MAVALKQRNYEEEKELTGTVVRLFHSSERFSAGRISVNSSPMLDRDCSFCIPGAVEIDKTITLRGRWIEDPKIMVRFHSLACNFVKP